MKWKLSFFAFFYNKSWKYINLACWGIFHAFVIICWLFSKFTCPDRQAVWSRSGLTHCRSWSGSKLFADDRWQKLALPVYSHWLRVQISDILQIFLFFFFQLFYACISLLRWNNAVQSQSGIGIAGVLLVALTVAAGLGITSVLRIAFNASTTQVCQIGGTEIIRGPLCHLKKCDLEENLEKIMFNEIQPKNLIYLELYLANTYFDTENAVGCNFSFWQLVYFRISIENSVDQTAPMEQSDLGLHSFL